MFRSAGANGTNGLYSPIANSDSSGFSEQRADLSSYSGSQGGPPGGYTTFNPAFRPVAGTGQGHIYDRSVFLTASSHRRVRNCFVFQVTTFFPIFGLLFPFST